MSLVAFIFYNRFSEFVVARMIESGRWESDNITEEDILIFVYELLEYLRLR